jgi:acetyltransferase-like isoleucine patch superfamily enzyme
VGKGVYIDFDVVIGDNVKIQNYACIYHGTIIDDGVFVGPHAVFTNDLRPRAINPDGTAKKDSDWSVLGTTVRFGASIGAASVILPGLTIDRHALIGAGSVVTRSVPAHGIVVGNPAKLVGYACVCAAALIIEDLVGVCPSCARQYTMTDLDGTFQFRVKEWIG